MQNRIQPGIDARRKEMEVGQPWIRGLERHVGQLRDTMLRKSGAIQVREEFQGPAAPAGAAADATADSGDGNIYGARDLAGVGAGADLLGE
jgi:hypothetical protein